MSVRNTMNTRCIRATLIAAALLPALLSGTKTSFAQRGLKNIPKPDVEAELAAFEVVDGFEISLFAADPLINKPIQINFDTAGRLWVASSSLYPHLKPGDVPEDRILVLEDRDGDGKADTSTVFADGLLMPTAVLPGNGGVYVANSTELLFLRDNDGDGRADERRVVLSGFGTEDTHHIIHTFRWGHDGFFYFNQSIYIHSHVETPHGVRRLNAGGIWQFRPDTLELGVFVYGMVNGWGQTFDQWGQQFGTDGAYGEGVLYFLPGASYVTAKTRAPVFHGLNRGTPKYCGADFVSGRHLPDDWQESFITNDFRAHRVVRYKVSDEGSGYSAELMPDVLRSRHIAFRPVDVKLGPDGAIYIADWYNPIIQHGEVSFRDSRRNHLNGRVWKLTAKGRPLVEKPRIAGASLPALFEHLKSPEGWTRDFAKQEIREHAAAEVVEALDRWTMALDADDPRYEHHLLEALWIKQGVRKPDAVLLTRLLNASEPRARAAAVRVLSHWIPSIPNSLELLATSVADDFPRVRLEAVRALGRVRNPRAVELATSVLERPMDRFLEYALGTTVRDLRNLWIAALREGSLDFGGSSRQLEFALKAAGSPNVVGPILELLRGGEVSPQRRASLLSVVAALGDAEQVAFAFEGALSLAGEANTADLTVNVLRSVRSAYAERKLSAPKISRVDSLLSHTDERVVTVACDLVALWKPKGGAETLASLARSAKAPSEVRRAALGGLVTIGDPEARSLIGGLSQPDDTNPSLRYDAVAALVALDAKAAAAMLAKVFGEKPPSDAIQRIFEAFLSQRDGSSALLASLVDRKIDAEIARIGIRVARDRSNVDDSLVAALAGAGGIDTRAVHSREELLEALASASLDGLARRGEAVFRRPDLRCLQCHAIAGAGGTVGPDLSTIGTSAQIDYTVDSLLDPPKAIKEGYHGVTFVKTSGEIVTGIPVRETQSSIIVKNADDVQIAVPKKDISIQSAGGSLMPQGLLDSLTRTEAVELFAFLASLGREPEFASRPVLRTWRVLASGLDSLRSLSVEEQGSAVARRGDRGFVAAYSTVSGDLPIATFRESTSASSDFAFAKGLIEVTTAGSVEIDLGDSAGLRLWVGGGLQSTTDGEVRVELPQGVHQVLLRVDLVSRRDTLRVTVGASPGSAARARFVRGK